jgi:hypothetical protein
LQHDINKFSMYICQSFTFTPPPVSVPPHLAIVPFLDALSIGWFDVAMSIQAVSTSLTNMIKIPHPIELCPCKSVYLANMLGPPFNWLTITQRCAMYHVLYESQLAWNGVTYRCRPERHNPEERYILFITCHPSRPRAMPPNSTMIISMPHWQTWIKINIKFNQSWSPLSLIKS